MNSREPNPKVPIPQAGDAARKARTEGDAINEAYGIPVAPRELYRAAGQIRLTAGGARQAPAGAASPDLSTRTAADYLPPKLRARLIAAGRLTADGAPVVEIPPAPAGIEPFAEPAAAPGGVLARMRRFFGKLF